MKIRRLFRIRVDSEMKVSVANITRPRGFKGELAVVPYKVNTQSLSVGRVVTLQKGNRTGEFMVEAVRPLKGRIALKLAGIDDEDSALAWQGGEVLVELENLATLNEDEYYHFDIEGSEVFEDGGAYLGKVTAIDYVAANDVLTVNGERGEILVPFVKSVVVSVDIRGKKIIIRKIAGLY
ncbi:MAG: 16S rRNA processing protein RimM [candidate division Zixibacteria bacterium RBG_16_53_22]|nr:MAG: 16S rRNA processing protein RimM [candidate division Zixibacteria bacterium RBG_16_53_22]